MANERQPLLTGSRTDEKHRPAEQTADYGTASSTPLRPSVALIKRRMEESKRPVADTKIIFNKDGFLKFFNDSNKGELTFFSTMLNQFCDYEDGTNFLLINREIKTALLNSPHFIKERSAAMDRHIQYLFKLRLQRIQTAKARVGSYDPLTRNIPLNDRVGYYQNRETLLQDFKKDENAERAINAFVKDPHMASNSAMNRSTVKTVIIALLMILLFVTLIPLYNIPIYYAHLIFTPVVLSPLGCLFLRLRNIPNNIDQVMTADLKRVQNEAKNYESTVFLRRNARMQDKLQCYLSSRARLFYSVLDDKRPSMVDATKHFLGMTYGMLNQDWLNDSKNQQVRDMLRHYQVSELKNVSDIKLEEFFGMNVSRNAESCTIEVLPDSYEQGATSNSKGTEPDGDADLLSARASPKK